MRRLLGNALLALLLALGTASVLAVQVSSNLPGAPSSVQATCATSEAVTGFLTQSIVNNPSIPGAAARITTPTVYPWYGTKDVDWSCTNAYLYSGVAWNTAAATGSIQWGLLLNDPAFPFCGNGGGVGLGSGTGPDYDDYFHANATTTCPSQTASVLAVNLSPEGVYQRDVAKNSFGDFSYVHASCDTPYGASVLQTGVSPLGTSNAEAPGANCSTTGFYDDTNTSQTITYDATAPTMGAFTAPASNPTFTTNTTPTFSWNAATDAVSGVEHYGVVPQSASIASPGVCSGSWTNMVAEVNNGLTTSYTHGAGMPSGTCYRVAVRAFDNNDNVAAYVFSNAYLVDTVKPSVSTSLDIGTTQYTNAATITSSWVTSDAESGIRSGLGGGVSHGRRTNSTPDGNGTCTGAPSGWTMTIGLALSGSRPPLAVLDGTCYQWATKAIDRAGNVYDQEIGVGLPGDPGATQWVMIDRIAPNFTSFIAPASQVEQNATSYTFVWNAGTDTYSGVGSYDIIRQSAPIIAPGVCGSTWTTVGSSNQPGTSYNFSSLAGGNCYRLSVQVDDRAGNASGYNDSMPVLVDTTDPSVTILTQPSDPTNSTSANFTFSSDGTGTAIVATDCKLDAGAYVACATSGSQNYLGLADGSHTFTVRVTDAAGNTGTDSYTWTIDTDDPETTITAAPTNPSNDNTPTFSFIADEAGSTFRCRVDGGAYAGCISGQSFGPLADGSHTFEVYATDPAGNDDLTPDSYTWTVDTTDPSVTILTQPSDPTNSTSANFTFSSDGTGTAIVATDCKLDAGAYVACATSGSQNYLGLADGSHTFTVRVTDAAGNTGTDSYTWTIDTVKPTVTIASVLPNPTTAGATVTWNADENGTYTIRVGGIGCASGTVVDSGSYSTSPANTTSTIPSGDLAQGANTVRVCVTDAASNTGSATASVTVDTTDPSVTILTQPSDPTNSTSANFTFSSDGTGTAIVATDCKLDAGAYVACATSGSQNYLGLADGSHTFTVRVTDAAGNTGTDSYTWTIDTVKPTTTATPSGTAGSNGWFTSTTVSVSLLATDAGSGVAGTTYEIASGGTTSYSGAFNVSGQGIHTVTFRSTDNAGNVENDKTLTVKIDSVPPVFSSFSAPPAQVNQSATSYIFSWKAGTDTTSGVDSYDIIRQSAPIITPGVCGSTWTTVGSSNQAGTTYNFNSLAGGSCYRLRVQVEDLAGNVSGYNNSMPVLVDTTPPPAPDVTGTGTRTHQTGNTVWFNPSLGGTLDLTAQNNGASGDKESGIKGHTFGALSSSSGWSPTGALFVTGDPSTREYTWSPGASDSRLGITATNDVGLTGPATTIALRGDATSPVVIWSPLPDAVNHTVLNGAESLVWTANDGLGSGLDLTSQSLQRQVGLPVSAGSCVGVTFANDGAPTTGNSPQTASGLVSGNCYQWVVTVSDLVGNTASGTSESVLVDTEAPSGLLSGQGADGGTVTTRSQDVTLTCACNDDANGSGIEFVRYAIDGGYNWDTTNWLPWGASSAVVSRILNSGSGTYTILAQIKDYAGNISTITTIITLQNAVSPPTLTAAALIVDCDAPADQSKWQLNTTGVIYWSVNAPICLVPTVVQPADGQGVDNRDPLTPYYGNLTAWWSATPAPADEPWLESYKLGANPSHNAPAPVGWPDASQLNPNVQSWDAADPTVFRFLVTKETAALTTSVPYILIPYELDATEQWCTETQGGGTCGAFTGPVGTFVAGDYQHVYPQLYLRLIALNSGQIPR